MTDNLEHHLSQIVLARTEIKNLRQQISALKHEHIKEIKSIKSKLDGMRCSSCGDKAVKIVNTTEQQASSSTERDGLTFRPIGVIETTFQNKRAVPRQPTILANSKGCIVIDINVFNNPEHALAGLQDFSHLWIIFHFHGTDSTNVPAKVTPPRLGGERRGVFSTRSPHRPCPIGLSLVKIQSIEGNKIHFLGVDMVNGTPVLDIKPYIPQYDCPVRDQLSSRPRTEGVSDAADAAGTGLNVEDDSYTGRSVSPRLTQPIGIDTSPLPRSPYGDTSSAQNIITPMSPSPESPASSELLEPRRLDSERGAPDGQERFTPPNTTQNNTDIRIASWISNPPSQAFQVNFTNDALARLHDLIGDRAQSFKASIEGLLSEDPRSQYVRTRYPDHEYSCVLEDLSISCVFDAQAATCTIVALRNAEDMQQS